MTQQKPLGLTADQIAERRKGIGGSDAGRIMSGDWRRLWVEKTGTAEPEDLSGNLAVQMGSATEDFNAFWFSKTTGRVVDRRGEHIVHKDYPFMRANLDGVTFTARGELAYWDAKHVGRLDEAAVLRYVPQMTHCATILGFDWWIISAFVGNSRHEIVENEIDPLFQAELIIKEREFWGFVERGEEPPDMTPAPVPKPKPKLRQLIVPTEGDVFDAMCREENWLPGCIEEMRAFAGTKAAADRHAIARKEIAGLVPEDIGLISWGLVRYKKDGRGISLSLEKIDA